MSAERRLAADLKPMSTHRAIDHTRRAHESSRNAAGRMSGDFGLASSSRTPDSRADLPTEMACRDRHDPLPC